MNRIILIGNGFDLAHGLLTGYKDFINNYWRDFTQKTYAIFTPYEDKLVKFETNGGPKNSYESMCATKFGVKNEKGYNYDGIINIFRQELTKDSSYSNIKQLITDFNEASDLQLNLLFKSKFFEHISKTTCLNTWLDIENEYYEQLKICVEIGDIQRTQQLNEDFEQIKNELEKYLTEETKNTLYQERKIKGLIYKDFVPIDFTKNGIDKLIEEEYSDYLKGLGEEDEKTIELHSHINELMNEEQIENARQYFEVNIFNMESMYPKNILFLNFNYTNTSYKYLQENYFRNKNNTIHIHGELNNRDNPIIFGYGDELDDDYLKIEKLNNNEYLKNVKSINYLKTKNYRKLLDFINTDYFQIFILGHSCGNSDRTLLNTLFEHKNCVSIKPFYYKKSDGTDNYEEIIMNISRNFKDKAAFREKVVNKTDCEPLPQVKKSIT
ncbi:MAG: bacteriophage abortive infection AbiH family protein [Firmicutes bacterium]|nr:bacteriophage abortive infection AbiH family protein [Bacillota bacterium]